MSRDELLQARHLFAKDHGVYPNKMVLTIPIINQMSKWCDISVESIRTTPTKIFGCDVSIGDDFKVIYEPR